MPETDPYPDDLWLIRRKLTLKLWARRQRLKKTWALIESVQDEIDDLERRLILSDRLLGLDSSRRSDPKPKYVWNKEKQQVERVR